MVVRITVRVQSLLSRKRGLVGLLLLLQCCIPVISLLHKFSSDLLWQKNCAQFEVIFLGLACSIRFHLPLTPWRTQLLPHGVPICNCHYERRTKGRHSYIWENGTIWATLLIHYCNSQTLYDKDVFMLFVSQFFYVQSVFAGIFESSKWWTDAINLIDLYVIPRHRFAFSITFATSAIRRASRSIELGWRWQCNSSKKTNPATAKLKYRPGHAFLTFSVKKNCRG